MAQRKLASVQYVYRITPIEGADQIECIHVLGRAVCHCRYEGAGRGEGSYGEITYDETTI